MPATVVRIFLLYGYGSYGFGISPTFSSERISLLDRGMAFAIAHIRGGDELGEQWREDGMLMKKKNSFFDFVDAAEFLIQQKWTSKDCLAIEGRSAGGLLVGAVVNLRPDLFRAAHAGVPFLDVINSMMDASLPLTVGEYLEWGDPNNKAAYDYAKCLPYSMTTWRSARIPAMLLTSSFNDSQGDVLGACQVCSAASHNQDGQQTFAVEDEDGSSRPRGRVGPL